VAAHEEVFCASDGDFVEDDFCAFQAIGGGFDVAVILCNFRAELFESFDVKVDGTAADGAAAGSETRARPQRATSGPRTRVEARMVLTSRRKLRAGEIFAVDGGAVMGASVTEFDLGSHGGEKIAGGLDVSYLRNVFEDDGFVGEQGGGHAGKRGIFCAADVDGAEQRLAAADDEFVHGDESLSKALF